MCGIAGIIGTGRASIERSLRAMAEAQVHRGPDDEGIEILACDGAHEGRFVGLAQRRLSIIDLSPLGHQPMVHPETGDVLIYNGELYNFQSLRRRLEGSGCVFRGRSDTEVLLHALVHWGAEALRELAGMYALAFYRARTRTLLLARDPMGIKPLYVTPGAESFVFASEVRAVLASGLVQPVLDARGVAGLLAYGSVPPRSTFFRGIDTFPPGCWQEIALGGDGRIVEGDRVRFWHYPRTDPGLDEVSATARVRETLDLAVREHLVSDVPVGVFLSSGLDSTIVAGLTARHTRNLHTMTVGFAEQPDMSEVDVARGTARRLGATHTELQITGHDAEEATRDWFRALDQPSVDGLNTYVISRAVRASGIVVALSGLGGDELFGGYPSFRDVPRFARLGRRLGWMPGWARAALARTAAARQTPEVRDKAGDMARCGADVLRLALYRRRLMSDRQLDRLGLRARDLDLDATFVPREALEEVEVLKGDEIAEVSRAESQFYMRTMLLRDSDTNGMAHGLEIRVPFLDRRMLDLAHAIPGPVRVPRGRPGKHLLRMAFPDLLPPEIQGLAKRGFWLPIRRWMVGPLRGACEESLGYAKTITVLRPQEIDAVWSRFLRAPDTQVWSWAFLLCVLGKYVKNTVLAAQTRAAQLGQAQPTTLRLVDAPARRPVRRRARLGRR